MGYGSRAMDLLQKYYEGKIQSLSEAEETELSNVRDEVCWVTFLPYLLGHHNSFPASGDFCRLLITFANSLDPDQARQNVGSDLDPNCLILWWYSWKIFLKKLILKKINRLQKSMQNYPACKEVTPYYTSKIRTNYLNIPLIWSTETTFHFDVWSDLVDKKNATRNHSHACMHTHMHAHTHTLIIQCAVILWVDNKVFDQSRQLVPLEQNSVSTIKIYKHLYIFCIKWTICAGWSIALGTVWIVLLYLTRRWVC